MTSSSTQEHKQHSQDSSRKRFLDDLNKISILSGREMEDEFFVQNDEDDDDISRTVGTTNSQPDGVEKKQARQSCFLSFLVILLGVISAVMFMSFGIESAISQAEEHIRHVIDEASLQIKATWDDYQMGSLWLHQACHNEKNISREHFHDLYQYMTTSLDVRVSPRENNYWLVRKGDVRIPVSTKQNGNSSFIFLLLLLLLISILHGYH